MKAFTFRLEQALRWRETQLAVQKAGVAAAAGRLAALIAKQAEARDRKDREGVAVAAHPDAASLAAWTGFSVQTDRTLSALKAEQAAAEHAIELELSKLREANRAVKLLDNLKKASRTRWLRESDGETAKFADEASLGRLQSGKGRARSSAG